MFKSKIPNLMEISLEQLEQLLVEQKRLVIERLLTHTYVYNTNTTDSESVPLRDIDKIQFTKHGLGASFPNDFNILKKYIR